MVTRAIVVALLLLTYNSFAQTDSVQCGLAVSGRVIDEHDKSPLQFATVYIKELERGSVADSTGRFKIENLCAGTYTFQVNHLGCEPAELQLNVKGNVDRDFYLEHHAHELGLINITEKKEETQSLQPAVTLQQSELDATRGQSLGESLSKIEGVNVLKTGASVAKPMIHGLHSNRILILNNGVRQEGQQWGAEHAPEIDPFIADKLVVVKGANAVRYGADAIAGVILVEPRPLRDSVGVGGEINLAGFSNGRQGVASAILEGNFKRLPPLSWRLQGTAKRAGNMHAPGYFLANTGFKELNFSGALGYAKENYGADIFYSRFSTTLGIFLGSHIGNLADLQKAFELQQPRYSSGFTYAISRPYQKVTHELVKIKSFLRAGDAGKLNFIYARQYNIRNEYDRHKPLNDSLAALNRPEVQYEITTHTADINWEHNFIRSFNGTVGISGITQGNTYAGRYFIPNYRNYGGGIFLIERWKKNKVEIEGGIRYDYKWLKVYKWENNEIISPEFNFGNVSGTLGTIYKISDNLNLLLNAGTAWRPPAVNELFSNGLHHGAAAVEIGDRTLKPEKALNTSVTADYSCRCNSKLNIRLTLYRNSISNFIYLAPQLPPVLTIRGAFPVFRYTQTDAILKGADATAGFYFTKRFSSTARASLLRAVNKISDEPLIMMPADRIENSLKYEFAESKKFKETYISVNVLHVAKQWRVPENSDFAAPPGTYTLFGIEAATAFFIAKKKVTVGITGTNLLNTTYRDYLNRFRYYADEAGRNISARMKIEF